MGHCCAIRGEQGLEGLLVRSVDEHYHAIALIDLPTIDGEPALIHAEDAGGRKIDWGSLPVIVIDWAEVPGTSIDEPIVQAIQNSPNSYLRIYALGQRVYGTPYIDCDCTIDSRFVMVYDHNMSDGSAFADFASCIDEDYANEHDEIIVYRRDGSTFHLNLVAIDVVNASRESLVINQETDFNEVVSRSDLALSEKLEDNRLFAFMTCSYQTNNSRTIVYAVSIYLEEI